MGGEGTIPPTSTWSWLEVAEAEMAEMHLPSLDVKFPPQSSLRPPMTIDTYGLAGAAAAAQDSSPLLREAAAVAAVGAVWWQQQNTITSTSTALAQCMRLESFAIGKKDVLDNDGPETGTTCIPHAHTNAVDEQKTMARAWREAWPGA